MSDVKLLAGWDGWCDPCATERPLVLVEVGPRGVKAWLGGVGIEDRSLSLTCRVCGQWQLVPQLEEDDEPVEDVAVVGAVAPEVVAEVAATPVIPQVEKDADVVVSPLLASALIPVRTAAFDESGRTVTASTPVEIAEPVEVATRPRTEVTLLDAVEDEPVAPRTRWFSRKPAAEVVDDAADEDEVEATVADVVLAEDVVPAARSRWFSRKTAVETAETAETAEVTETADIAEVVQPPVAEVEDVPAVAPEAVEQTAPRPRWFTRKTTVAPVINATEIDPTNEQPARPVRSIAPDVEEPVRPHKVNPAAVRPLPQTRAIPVPRTYRSPVRAASATDTAPLALLAAGYDVVAAGSR